MRADSLDIGKKRHGYSVAIMALTSGQGDPDANVAVSAVDALSSLEPIKIVDATPKFTYSQTEIYHSLPSPSIQRRIDSLNDNAVDLHPSVGVTSPTVQVHSQTVFYLAYGSNLCAETFQGKRGIQPISQLNVVVPELVLTFDLAGLPYLEPCFANTRYRIQESSEWGSEKASRLPSGLPAHRYHKTRWRKGLVGVVYEVTREDFARIISTEGGGASYHDILVDCYELPLGEDIVPAYPDSQPFKAHTLYSPSFPPVSDAPSGVRGTRPDPNYAQASRRYLKLLADGADEHHLPMEYKFYLHQLRPYVATTVGQKIGGVLVMMTWVPLLASLFTLAKLLADERGRSPAWLTSLLNIYFNACWMSYDLVFKRIFGDGERTIGNEDDGEEELTS